MKTFKVMKNNTNKVQYETTNAAELNKYLEQQTTFRVCQLNALEVIVFVK